MQQFHKLFKERENQIIEEVSLAAKEVARKELALLEFELFYEAMIPEESKERAKNALQKMRSQKWQDALKKANGDEEKAIFYVV